MVIFFVTYNVLTAGAVSLLLRPSEQYLVAPSGNNVGVTLAAAVLIWTCLLAAMKNPDMDEGCDMDDDRFAHSDWLIRSHFVARYR